MEQNSAMPPANGLKKRSIGLAILFTILTCGIYGFYWMVQLTDESRMLAGDMDATSGGMALLFCIITCGIYGIYWNYRLGECLDKVREAKGTAAGNLAILYLVLSIFGLGIISFSLAQNELNKYAAE